MQIRTIPAGHALAPWLRAYPWPVELEHPASASAAINISVRNMSMLPAYACRKARNKARIASRPGPHT